MINDIIPIIYKYSSIQDIYEFKMINKMWYSASSNNKIKSRLLNTILLPINEELISDFIRYLLHSSSLHGVSYKGTLYQELENQWSKMKHSTHICIGYWNHEWNKEPNYIVLENNDEIKYHVNFNSFLDNSYYEDSNEKVFNYLQKIVNKIEKNQRVSAKNIIIEFDDTDIDKIDFYNKIGIYNDHRGSDHCILKLPLEHAIELKNKFSLDDLCIALYKLKSHKWDKWYELYCGSKIKIRNNTLKIYLNFDHGS